MSQPPAPILAREAGADAAEAPAAAETGYAKSRDTRARILAAALEEAGESGFYGTSVARIAARAGVAIGSVNYHFGSRARLIRELMQQLMDDYMAHVQVAEAESRGDWFARERAVLLAYVAYVRRDPAFTRLADEIKVHEPALYRRGAGQWVERMAGRLRAGIAEGTLRPMDEKELRLKSRFLLGARHALEDLAQGDASLSDEEAVDAYLELVGDGLRAIGGESEHERDANARANGTRQETMQ